MPALILFAFIAIPVAEIAVLVEVGGAIGVWPTLGAVVATALFGTWMLRLQGLSALARAQASLTRGAFPAREVFDGLCLAFAGALLLTPGFLTDAAGLLLTAPPVRAVLRRRVLAWLRARGRVRMAGMDGAPGKDGEDTVIDGAFEEVDPDRTETGRAELSPWTPPRRGRRGARAGK